MAVNVAEMIAKLQEEGLRTIKQTQDASLAVINDFNHMGRSLAEKPGVPAFENLPTPTQFVEMSFGFASQVLELRKAYTLRIAELLVETQKQAEATIKSATSSVSPNGAHTAPAPRPAQPSAK